MTHILIFLHWFVLVFTFGNVELVTVDNSKSNDFPIEELNGYTLREVFEVSNIWNDTTSQVRTVAYTKIINGNEITSINTGAFDEFNYLRTPITTYDSGNKYYYRSDIKVNSNANTFNYVIGFSSSADGVFITPTTEYITYKGYITLTSPRTQYGHHMIILTGTNNDYSLSTKNNYSIDMTNLGISSFTVQQMDDWFNVYQENAQREISETYDYIENELTTNDLIYIVLFALLWCLAFKIVKGVM